MYPLLSTIQQLNIFWKSLTVMTIKIACGPTIKYINHSECSNCPITPETCTSTKVSVNQIIRECIPHRYWKEHERTKDKLLYLNVWSSYCTPSFSYEYIMTVDSLAGRQSILSREALLKEHWKPARMNNAKYSHTVLLDLINKECRPRANCDLSLNIKTFVITQIPRKRQSKTGGKQG